jgi:hypothetical protein
MADLMSFNEYARRHGYRDMGRLRRLYRERVLDPTAGAQFQAAHDEPGEGPNWRNLVDQEPGYAGAEGLRNVDYKEFLGLHPGTQSSPLMAARYRQGRGEALTPQMRQALVRGAQGANATGSAPVTGKPTAPVPDQPPHDPRQLIRAVPPGSRLASPSGPPAAPNRPAGAPGSAPDAPRVGTRVSPGSVPMDKKRRRPHPTRKNLSGGWG